MNGGIAPRADRSSADFKPGTIARPGALALAVLALLLQTNSSSLSAQIVWASVAFTLFTSVLLWVVLTTSHYRSLAGFGLGPWMLVVAIVSYGLATVTILDGTARVVDPRIVPQALAICAGGLAAFTFGLMAAPSDASRWVAQLLSGGPARDRSVPRSGSTLIIVYGTGLVATAAQIVLLGGYGYLGGATVSATSEVAASTQLFVIALGLRTAVLYGLALRWATTGRPADAIAVLCVLTSEISLGLIGAQKESFVIAVLAVLIPIVTKRRRLPWLRALAAAAVFVLFVTPFVTDLREQVRDGTERLDVRTSLATAADSLTGNWNETRASSDAESSLTQVSMRVRLVDNMVVIVDKTPDQIPYRPLSEFATGPLTGIVPRVVWRDKPIRLTGLEFYKTYYEGQGESSSATTFQGSLFMHGGPIVVFVVMLIYGVCIGLLDRARAQCNPALSGLLAVILFVPVVKQELDAVTLLASLPIYVITYYCYSWAVLDRDGPRGPAR